MLILFAHRRSSVSLLSEKREIPAFRFQLTTAAASGQASAFPGFGSLAYDGAKRPPKAFPAHGEGGAQRRMRSPVPCHCEPVRTPVWQSVSPSSVILSGAKDLVLSGELSRRVPRKRRDGGSSPRSRCRGALRIPRRRGYFFNGYCFVRFFDFKEY